jgi:hypothetical protein
MEATQRAAKHDQRPNSGDMPERNLKRYKSIRKTLIGCFFRSVRSIACPIRLFTHVCSEAFNRGGRTEGILN